MHNNFKAFDSGIRIAPGFASDPLQGRLFEIYSNTTRGVLRVCVSESPLVWTDLGVAPGTTDNSSLTWDIGAGAWTENTSVLIDTNKVYAPSASLGISLSVLGGDATTAGNYGGTLYLGGGTGTLGLGDTVILSPSLRAADGITGAGLTLRAGDSSAASTNGGTLLISAGSGGSGGVYGDLQLRGNRVYLNGINSINVGAQLAADPSSPQVGDWYLNTHWNKFRFFSNGAWHFDTTNGLIKVDLFDSTTAVLPTTTATTIDGTTVTAGMVVVFAGLTSGSGYYFANVSGSAITWDVYPVGQNPAGGFTLGDKIFVKLGTAYSLSEFNYDGSSWFESLSYRNGDIQIAAKTGRVILTGTAINLNAASATDPVSANAKDVYYNTATKTFRFYDGTSWNNIGPSTIPTKVHFADGQVGVNLYSTDLTTANILSLEYSIARGPAYESGVLYVSTDGINVSTSTTGSNIGDPAIDFGGNVLSGILYVTFDADANGNDGSINYLVNTSWLHVGSSPPPAFTSIWQIPSPSYSLQFPASTTSPSAAYNCTVDWGDGSPTTNLTTANAATARLHTYASAGAYTISITGQYKGFYCSQSGDSQYLTSITNWGTAQFSAGSNFQYTSSLSTISAPQALDLGGCTDLSYAFYESGIHTIPHIGLWDVSGVTTMAYMFSGCTNFNQDIIGWNTSAVLNMEYMFNGCTAFNGDVDSFNLASVTNMSYMFFGCTHFNKGLSSWSPANVTNMSNMFSECTAMNGILSGWDIRNVLNMSSMFYGCQNFTGIGLSTWSPLSATDMSSMFGSCTSFNANLSSWNTASVTSMSGMFAGCTSFNNAGVASWNVANVTTMYGMFSGCAIFNQDLPWTTTSLAHISYMFSGCTAFNGNVNSWNISLAHDLSWIFDGCAALNRDITWSGTSTVTNLSYAFNNCTSFNGDITSWNVSSVTNMAGMFTGCTSFNRNLSSWNTVSVQDMSGMFYGCTSFNSPLTVTASHWNVASVSNMETMFLGCASFDQDLSSWGGPGTSTTGARRMFEGCTNYTGIGLSSWDTSAVTDMTNMFYRCPAFNGNVIGWDVTNVVSMNYMFDGDTAFNQNLGSWNVASLQTAQYMLSSCGLSSPNYDALLIGWSALPSLVSGVRLNADAQYSPAAASARSVLTSAPHNWIITDGGPV